MLTDATMLAIAQMVAKGFEFAGIAVIVIGTLIAFAKAGAMVARGLGDGGAAGERDVVPAFRKTLGRSILTGLELLVAADIIRTVAVEPTLQSVLVLGLIVLIRTFLSFSLEVEIDGRWPWQGKRE
ncbi:DUF1622 domain-containing protein [Flavisphingopyxis soli]|nr:DUF1622 domain-containing protein [Sphingorhabdus soli]